MRGLDPGRGGGSRLKCGPAGAQDSHDRRGGVLSLPGVRASQGPERSPADPSSRCLSPQGGDHLPEGRRQHPGAALARGEYLPDLLRGGPLSEAGAVREGADALGEERGTRPAPPPPRVPTRPPRGTRDPPALSVHVVLGWASWTCLPGRTESSAPRAQTARALSQRDDPKPWLTGFAGPDREGSRSTWPSRLVPRLAFGSCRWRGCSGAVPSQNSRNRLHLLWCCFHGTCHR